MARMPSTSRALRLPTPLRATGSLDRALRARRTTREISDRPVPLRVLSGLLWAAWGVNRPRGPFGMAGRTAASASNSQELVLQVLTAEGAYRYEPGRHRLVPVVGRDLRHLCLNPGQGLLGARAPVRLLYVVDLDRLEHTGGFEEPGLHDPAVQPSYYFVDTGLIAAKVYLYSAETGLAGWFHNCQREALRRALGLGPREHVLFAQTVGYPAHRARKPKAQRRTGRQSGTRRMPAPASG